MGRIYQPAAPQVSIILPSSNRFRLLKDALESVRRQSFQDWELLIVDNGFAREASDAAEAMVAGCRDARLRLIRVPVHGAAAALNAGLSFARGEWVAFTDEDQLWLPEKLAAQMCCARKTDADLIFTSAVIERDGTPLGVTPSASRDFSFEGLLEQPRPPERTLLVRRRAVQAAGGFDPSLRCFDYDFWLRLALQSRFHWIRRPLAVIRLQPQSLAAEDAAIEQHSERARVLQKLAGYADAERRALVRRALAAEEYALGQSLAKHRRWAEAAAAFRRALIQDPGVGAQSAEAEDSFAEYLREAASPYVAFALAQGRAWLPGRSRAAAKAPQHVLIVESGSGYGGTGRYLAGLVRHLADFRDRLAIVAAQEGPFIRSLGAEGADLSVRPRWRFCWADALPRRRWLRGPWVFYPVALAQLLWTVPAIALWLRRRQVRVVHLNNEIYSHIPMILAAHLAGARSLCHLHGWRRLTRLELAAARWVDAFITLTDPAARLYSDQLRRPVGVVHNGMEPREGVAPEIKVSERRRLHLAPEERVVVALGRLIPLKGFDVLIRAAAKLIHEGRPLQVLIVGADPTPDDATRHYLQKLARRLGVFERVHFMGWQDDVEPYYAVADLVVLSSVEPEASPMVVLEAQARGLPVVATRVGGVDDLIADGRNGVLVAAGDALALSEGMRRVLDDEAFAQNLRDNGPLNIRERFRPDRNAEEISALYNRLLQPHSVFGAAAGSEAQPAESAG